MRPIPVAAVDIVAKWEGFRAQAYLCPAQVWTIGYGHTKGVKSGDVINESAAREVLKADLIEAAMRLQAAVGVDAIGRLNDNQHAAMLSFVFNLGIKAEWDIVECLHKGDLQGVPAQMARFVFAGGKKLEGLVRRRADEVDLWKRPLADAVDPPRPRHETTTVTLPPAPPVEADITIPADVAEENWERRPQRHWLAELLAAVLSVFRRRR